MSKYRKGTHPLRKFLTEWKDSKTPHPLKKYIIRWVYRKNV
jgi:hypothetical protein